MPKAGSTLLALPGWALTGACCALPVLWLAWQMAAHPATLAAAIPTAFTAELLAKTLLYNFSVAVITVILALPAALVIGRGRGIIAGALAFVLPIPLLLPSVAYAYGWSQVLRSLGLTPEPGSGPDVLRCVWTLAAWLWALPAGVMGLALRRVDTDLQQQALLDGVYWRLTLRQLAGPLTASLAIVMTLAMQEFAVYEPTGISVVATQVRAVFDVGQPVVTPAQLAAVTGPALPADFGYTTLAQRSALAVATALPMLLVIALLAAAAAWVLVRVTADEAVESGPWPRALNAGAGPTLLAILVLALTVAVPIVAMALSIRQHASLPRLLQTYSPEIVGTLSVSAATGLVALGLAFWATLRRATGMLLLGVVTFLIGGQLLAIAQIRMYNRPSLDWIYNAPPMVMLAYLARFGWLALLAGWATWTRPWRQLRDLAAIDGAGATHTARYVIWPLACPVLLAAGVLVMVLSSTEVPATILLQPLRPRMFTTLLMTWVHTLRSDDMLQASLLLMCTALALGAAAMALLGMGRRMFRGAAVCLLAGLLLSATGCGRSSTPQAIWCETGGGPGQVIYPRGIAYSAADDSVFIVDRMARVQHLDHQGKFLGGWRMPEWAHGKPVGLYVAPDGDLYVPDTHYNRVLVYAPDGHLKRSWGELGTKPGQFIYPTDIAFDRAGHVYVSEYGDNDRIQVFDAQGHYLRQFGSFGQGDGQFVRPQSMIIDGDRVYITDACNHRLVVFKTDGTFVRNMGQLGSGLGEFRFPYGLAEDPQGRLVVCEFGNNRVQLIDKDTGRGLAVWGMAGRAGQLAYPWGVVVDRAGRVIVVDAGNNRLQVFEF